MTNPPRPFGLPIQPGSLNLSTKVWDAIVGFIESRVWYFIEPCLATDLADPLLSPVPKSGAFLMGFDFHITSEGPRLIEINTNAGGYATAMSLVPDAERAAMQNAFVAGVRAEFTAVFPERTLVRVAIVDDAIAEQGLYTEMRHFSELLAADGVETLLLNPEDLRLEKNVLSSGGKKIDLVLNRLVDFRLTQPAHQVLRDAALTQAAALTPHPGVYVRTADKRNFLKLKHPLVPQTHLLSDRPLVEWENDRKHWVFKPATGAASKGVYRGDKLSRTKFATLPLDTIVQRLVEPMRTSDGYKYDVRVFTHDAKILGVAARQYAGQVMEMQTEHAGFTAVKINP